jgi:hypothetical protein
MSVQVKQAICHHPIGRLFRASLLCLLTMAAPAANAQTAGIEQAFSGSLTSETRPLVLRRVAYFDTGGKMVESYLKAPVALKPFSTVEVFVPATDVRGGTGANFVVDWAATGEIAEPVVEALMFGGIGSGHYAFVSQGRPIKITGKN